MRFLSGQYVFFALLQHLLTALLLVVSQSSAQAQPPLSPGYCFKCDSCTSVKAVELFYAKLPSPARYVIALELRDCHDPRDPLIELTCGPGIGTGPPATLSRMLITGTLPCKALARFQRSTIGRGPTWEAKPGSGTLLVTFKSRYANGLNPLVDATGTLSFVPFREAPFDVPVHVQLIPHICR